MILWCEMEAKHSHMSRTESIIPSMLDHIEVQKKIYVTLPKKEQSIDNVILFWGNNNFHSRLNILTNTSTKTTAHTLSFQHPSGTFTITCFIRTTIIMDGIHHHHVVVVVGVISASGFFGVFGNTNTTKLSGGSESSTAGDFFPM